MEDVKVAKEKPKVDAKDAKVDAKVDVKAEANLDYSKDAKAQ